MIRVEVGRQFSGPAAARPSCEAQGDLLRMVSVRPSATRKFSSWPVKDGMKAIERDYRNMGVMIFEQPPSLEEIIGNIGRA